MHKSWPEPGEVAPTLPAPDLCELSCKARSQEPLRQVVAVAAPAVAAVKESLVMLQSI